MIIIVNHIIVMISYINVSLHNKSSNYCLHNYYYRITNTKLLHIIYHNMLPQGPAAVSSSLV